MNTLIGNAIGDIHITVYETHGKTPIFYIKADNKDLLPVLDYLHDTLDNFKSKH